ncbi:ribonuclease h [Pyrenophora seminiperda CCB06]|uniref:Ribonuclease h n=1 Tax=Pyrenophora seminiperda CCB06 TaxID=1302712 RepID=A0A3M7MBU8_9PLEO|nr:ribonuclease h [Pyrenophora seminiperda CCB06]
MFRQTQLIEPAYLSTDPITGRRHDQTVHFTLSYSHETSDLAALYARLSPHSSAVSHVSDAFTKTTALFSGIEVKPSSGNKPEAEYQVSIWMGASLRKKAELARKAGLSEMTSVLIEPAIVVVGSEWYFYLVYLQPTGAVHVLEHGRCSTISISGVFKILRVLKNIIEYGLEGFEGGPEAKAGYWGGFLGPVLERLAVGAERAKGNASAATPGDYMID